MLAKINAQSVDDCCALCSQRVDCDGYVFHLDQCYLKKNLGASSVKQFAITRVKSTCGGYAPPMPDVDMSGDLLAKLWASDMRQCCSLCDSTPGCEGYVFHLDQCYLKRGLASPSTKPGATTRLRYGSWNTESVQPGKEAPSDECVFPTNYGGHTVDGCTTEGHHEAWCYVDSSRRHWRACGASDNACSFPFTYHNTKNWECTTEAHDQPWCYVVGGGWKNCNAEPVAPVQGWPSPSPAPAQSTSMTMRASCTSRVTLLRVTFCRLYLGGLRGTPTLPPPENGWELKVGECSPDGRGGAYKASGASTYFPSDPECADRLFVHVDHYPEETCTSAKDNSGFTVFTDGQCSRCCDIKTGACNYGCQAWSEYR